jgi:hypothetical protein
VPTEADVLTRLTVALDGLAAAMESGDPDAVLAAEAPVGTAVSALRLVPVAELARRSDVRSKVLDAKLALARCRTLGHAATRMTAIVTSTGYGPSGRHQSQPVPPTTVGTKS